MQLQMIFIISDMTQPQECSQFHLVELAGTTSRPTWTWLRQRAAGGRSSSMEDNNSVSQLESTLTPALTGLTPLVVEWHTLRKVWLYCILNLWRRPTFWFFWTSQNHGRYTSEVWEMWKKHLVLMFAPSQEKSYMLCICLCNFHVGCGSVLVLCIFAQEKPERPWKEVWRKQSEFCFVQIQYCLIFTAKQRNLILTISAKLKMCVCHLFVCRLDSQCGVLSGRGLHSLLCYWPHEWILGIQGVCFHSVIACHGMKTVIASCWNKHHISKSTGHGQQQKLVVFQNDILLYQAAAHLICPLHREMVISLDSKAIQFASILCCLLASSQRASPYRETQKWMQSLATQTDFCCQGNCCFDFRIVSSVMLGQFGISDEDILSGLKCPKNSCVWILKR